MVVGDVSFDVFYVCFVVLGDGRAGRREGESSRGGGGGGGGGREGTIEGTYHCFCFKTAVGVSVSNCRL